MKTALQVLTAIMDKAVSDPADIQTLRAFVPGVNLPPDELTCEVIQRAIKRQMELAAELVSRNRARSPSPFR